MAMEKQQVLQGAVQALNGDDKPWAVTVEGDSIVGRGKWMDARFFSPASITNEEREYIFTVTLKDNGKWQEIDKATNKASGVSFSGGSLSFGSSSSSFKGKMSQKSVSFGLGQNKQDGSIGIIKSSLDTSLIKDSVRRYLTQCGWKKAGLL